MTAPMSSGPRIELAPSGRRSEEMHMQLGMIGLGRMGANIVRRLMRDGHPCVVYNRSPAPVRELSDEGAIGTHSLDEFVAALERPRVAWVMLPAAIAGE